MAGSVQPCPSGTSSTSFTFTPAAAPACEAAVLLFLCLRRHIPQTVTLVEGILEVPLLAVELTCVPMSP